MTYNKDIGTIKKNANETNKGISYQTEYTYDNNGNQVKIEKHYVNNDALFEFNIEELDYEKGAGNV